VLVHKPMSAHKHKLIAVSIVGGLVSSIAVALSVYARLPQPALPELVKLNQGEVFYQKSGEFTQSGNAVDPPRVRISLPEPIEIMKYQVTSADYQRCVDDLACQPLDGRFSSLSADRPAVDLSWHDADSYAVWLSQKSGETFRLPTDEEWIFAAGDRIAADERNDGGEKDQASSVLPAFYAFSPKTFGLGTFGSNRNGIFDIAGNVWEWTSTCMVRRSLDSNGTVISENTNCGVRVAEGRHRAYIIDILRDPRASGCVGIPPTHLGFRLVHEQRSRESWIRTARRALFSILSPSHTAEPART
jgi:formylglycine-generating enzyme required for sulfatase activity